ncbi:MAG: hypothetical protein ACI9SY_000574, partial [Candidatus Paceibacteria bacterium]
AEKGNPQGYQYMDANVRGNPSLTMNAHAADGSTSECRIVIPVADKKAPSCTLTTDKSSYELGDRIKVSWTSSDANYVAFVPDTSGKDNLIVTAEKGNPQGYQYMDANVRGNPSLTMNAHAADGSTSECRIVIPVE